MGRDAPRGPRVTPTASATMSMPSWIFMRDFMSKVSSLASARTLRVAPRTRTARVARGLVTLPARAWSIEGDGMGREGLAAAPWKNFNYVASSAESRTRASTGDERIDGTTTRDGNHAWFLRVDIVRR